MSYTETHRVARTLDCRTCDATVAGDDITDLVAAMFRSLHGEGHETTDSAEEGEK